MPRRAVEKIAAWSYSRLTTWQQCPRKAKYSYIDKLPTKTNDAMERGSAIHKLAEHYVKGEIDELPEELELFTEEFELMRHLTEDPHYELLVEQQWAFDRNWQKTSWFGKQAWCRVVIDLGVYNKAENILTIIDHKTGKARPEHATQLKLYGTAGFSMFPSLAEVNAEMWYLDQGFINTEDNETTTFLPEELDDMIAFWNTEAGKMLKDGAFRPNPSRLCAWCDFSKANGGPCQY